MIRLIFFVLFAVAPVMAQEVIFNHRPEDRNYLHYYAIWNQFDAAVVMYEFGEVMLVQGTIRRQIPLSGFVKNAEKIQGAGTPGVCADIQALARTENFVLPDRPGGDIRWFGRLQSFRTPCDPARYDTAHGEGPNRPSSDWGVLDQTEFVVQLVRSGDDVVLAVLDSLGVHPTGATIADTRYGNNILSVVHEYPVPQGHAGETVYVRISPRRYGPTPLGLTISKYSARINLTAELHLPDTEIQQLRERWFTEFLSYCDSVKAGTGWLPELRGITFTGNQSDRFYNRYFQQRTDSTTGSVGWFEKHTSPAAKRGAPDAVQRLGPVRIAPAAILRGVTPHPIVSENVEVSIACTDETQARLRLVSIQGAGVATVWSGVLHGGKYDIPVTIPARVPNGAYLLLLEKNTGEQLYQQAVVVAR